MNITGYECGDHWKKKPFFANAVMHLFCNAASFKFRINQQKKQLVVLLSVLVNGWNIDELVNISVWLECCSKRIKKWGKNDMFHTWNNIYVIISSQLEKKKRFKCKNCLIECIFMKKLYIKILVKNQHTEKRNAVSVIILGFFHTLSI